MFPFTRVQFGVPIFDPNPYQCPAIPDFPHKMTPDEGGCQFEQEAPTGFFFDQRTRQCKTHENNWWTEMAMEVLRSTKGFQVHYFLGTWFSARGYCFIRYQFIFCGDLGPKGRLLYQVPSQRCSGAGRGSWMPRLSIPFQVVLPRQVDTIAPVCGMTCIRPLEAHGFEGATMV